MIRICPRIAVSLILFALLLTSCAVNLRPAEPAIPEDPAPQTASEDLSGAGTEEKPGMIPETAAPETDAPGTEKPETDAPGTETESPETEKPETEAPEPEQAETESPEPEQPEPEAPEPEQPEPALPPAPGDGGTVEGDTWLDGELGLRFVLPGEDWRFEQGGEDGSEPEESRYVLQAVSEAGSTVLLMERRIPSPGDGGERVTLAEYVGILTESMTGAGGEEVEIRSGDPVTAELAGTFWTRVDFALTWPGDAESRSFWFTRETAGWFLTLAVTASPADWLDAEGILSMLTSAGAPLPEKPAKPGDPVPPAVFAWGSDSLEGNVYRCGFAGIAVTAADGWRFFTEGELSKRNDFHVAADADSAAIAEAADRENSRCVMRLENGAGASAELSFIRAEAFGEGGWEQYAAYLTDSLLQSGEKAGFAMSATEGEWASMAGENWFVRIVTYSAGGYPVGQRMLLWRPVEGELAELTLDNGVWTDIPLSAMLAMISAAGT